ncbi:hypothetical protein [Anditalea andensis]|uniref:Uncharacterized protein n=1 Tax=Anditalea andensis TaxID=1048983 RepID=A0A074KX11_9BACT|nr:hypothetical protein [Anditalea andensis]KEO72765.1 hypothetical protein EL17_14100 [Anditalea andensis]
MTEEEFELLDELYFVQGYGYLKEELGWDDEKLLITLQELFEKGYIKCLTHPDKELFDQINIEAKGASYFYLATKKGLMHHNTRS